MIKPLTWNHDAPNLNCGNRYFSLKEKTLMKAYNDSDVNEDERLIKPSTNGFLQNF